QFPFVNQVADVLGRAFPSIGQGGGGVGGGVSSDEPPGPQAGQDAGQHPPQLGAPGEVQDGGGAKEEDAGAGHSTGSNSGGTNGTSTQPSFVPVWYCKILTSRIIFSPRSGAGLAHNTNLNFI
ncbi:MAG: hypothetical protein QGF09_04740, partial [Rhodospirillales bacterium]|nr:hypothetical protein [Rhodospirillales bacterium]